MGELAGQTFQGVTGEEIYFAPGKNEDWDSYTNHLICGAGGETPNSGRVKALWLIEDTIQNPVAVFEQQNGKRAYVSLYEDDKQTAHHIVVQVDSDGRARAVTSIISKDTGTSSAKASNYVKSQIAKAGEILFMDGVTKERDLRTRHWRGPADQSASSESALLHRPGERNIAPTNVGVKKAAEIQAALASEAAVNNDGGLPVGSAIQPGSVSQTAATTPPAGFRRLGDATARANPVTSSVEKQRHAPSQTQEVFKASRERVSPPGAPVNDEKPPHRAAAEAVAERLNRGEAIANNRALSDITDEAYGGTQGEGKYAVKDAYDAMELGVNLHLRDTKINPSGAKTANEARQAIERIEAAILSKLPTQTNRTAEQNEFQQFSTPPNLAYAAGWLLNAQEGDMVLEPSAGIGGLAVFAKNAGAKVIVNELSERRAKVLREMGFDEVHTENAEQLHNILPANVKPNKIIMNPPFSATAGRKEGQRNTKNATLHVEQALKRLEPGGRAVMILGKGMAADAPAFKAWWNKIKAEYNVRANVELGGKDYYKYGTSFGQVIAVIDKNGPTPEGSTVTGKYESIKDALGDLEQVAKDSASKESLLAHLKEKQRAYEQEELRNGRVPVFNARELGKITALENEIEQEKRTKAAGESKPIYATESGKSLQEAAPEDFVLKNGSRKWGEITEALTGGNKNIPTGELRVQVGNEFWGLNHAKKHEVDIKKKLGFENTEEHINHTFQHANILIPVGDGKEFIVEERKYGKYSPSAVIKWNEEGGFYSLTTSFPVPRQYIENQKEKSLSLESTSQASAPAQTPLASNASTPGPEGSADLRYGNSDLTKKSITPETKLDNKRKHESRPGPAAREKTDSEVDVRQKSDEERAAERAEKLTPEDDDSVYDEYAPAKLKIEGAKPHTADLVQSAAMAAVDPPDPWYKPKLPKKMITSGALSVAQLEAVVYAGQSFTVTLPDGSTRGFFIGDGTGVGKGRTISGIITDQLAQGRGNGKAVWVSMNEGLKKDAERDWEDIGNDPEGAVKIFSQKKTGPSFTAYTTLRSSERRTQLGDWLGKDYDGVIVLDECHNANNAMDAQGERGVKKASQQAMAIQELLKEFPKARVLYVSATGATEVRNLAMLDRLGLWGEGTPFPSKQAFISEIEKGGTAAMELVARDMKAMGLYIARSISYRAGPNGGPENVTFERLEHRLTEHQTAVFDRIAEAWQTVMANISEAIKLTCGEEAKKSKNTRGAAMAQFWNSHQRCFNQIITALQTPSLIVAAEKDLAEGKSVVIQITNTNEADQKRALDRLEEGDTLEDLDVTPRDTLVNFLKNSFPVQQKQEVKDENGNTYLAPVFDSRGNSVLNREAVAIRDGLIADVQSISFPDSPLDMIINAFGADNVAEITGRTERVVKAGGKRVREKRATAAREADKLAFQDGRKRVLVFSEAGGTGASYHASNAAKNRQKRRHYLLQAGWKADAAIQGLGRTHRSNEAHKPEYVLVTTDLPGQKRFVSTIARRLEQLGALTTGERKAAAQGLFSERDNLESRHAQAAVAKLFDHITRFGAGSLDSGDLLNKLGFTRILNESGGIDAKSAPKVQQFLNRLLSLQAEAQREVFELFEEFLDRELELAASRGELDVGTETLRADGIEILQETVVYQDEERGIETRYLELETSHRQSPVKPETVKDCEFFVSKKTGRLLAARKSKASETNPKTGEIEAQYKISGVDPSFKNKLSESLLRNERYYTPLSAEEAARLWKEAEEEFPSFRKERRHLITGAILPIWDRLEGNPRIVRVTTKDGQTFLGRVIPSESLMHTLRALGAEYQNGRVITAKDVLEGISQPGAVAELANGWKIKESRVNGEKRVELIGPDFTFRPRLKNMGLISELIGYKERWFIPIGDERTLDAVLKDAPAVEIRKGDLLSSAAAGVNEGKEDFDLNDYAGLTVKDYSGSERNDQVSRSEKQESFSFESEETEKRYTAARKGVKRAGSISRLADASKEFVRGLTSDFPALRENKFIFAREALRRLNRKKQAAVGKSITTLRNTVKSMSPEQFDLFTRKRILDDLLWQKEQTPGSALPYGFTDKQLEREYERVSDEAAKHGVIGEAIRWEESLIKEINEKMVAEADKLGWHTLAERFKNPHYFRHVVLEYANAAAGGSKAGLYAPENRGYLKKRQGSTLDISSHYIQAMGEVRALQLQDIETMKILTELRGEYDVSEGLKREALLQNEQAFLRELAGLAEDKGMNSLDARAYASEQLSELNKKQAVAISRLFRMAREGTLPIGKFSSLVGAMAEAGSAEELSKDFRKELNRYISWLAEIEDGDADAAITAKGYFAGAANKKKVIKETLGDKHVTWQDLIPEGYVEWHPFMNRLVFSVNTVAENIVEQALDAGLETLSIPIDALEKARVLGGFRQTWAIPAELASSLDEFGKPIERSALGKIAKEVTTQIKEWFLHSPQRIIKYSLRNVTGDIDAVIAANPNSLRYMKRAFEELANVYLKGQAPSGELAEFAGRGGTVGAMHVQELGTDTTVEEFRRMLAHSGEGNKNLPKRAWKAYWAQARNISDFREGVLRYATYLSYLDQMQKSKDGKPKNWGASKREEVMANRDARDRAYKLANELLGAYDQVSESGQMLRDVMIPFYSWMEVNAGRYLQIFRNGLEDGKKLSGAAKTMLAWRLGKTALKVSMFALLVQLFNRLLHGDEEDDLPPDVRNRPHLILGRDAEGRVIYFDRVGAFADFLDWFALDSAPQEIRDILNGYQTWGDYAKKMAQAPFSKLINALNPIVKTPMEIVSGKQYFPDAFNPRSIRELSVYIAGTLGLGPEFVALSGRPSRGYLKGRLTNMFVYTSDPDEAAYWWIHDKQRQYEEKVLGRTWSGAATSKRSIALANIRRATRYQDASAYTKYVNEYENYGGTAKGLIRSLQSMEPMAGLSARDKAGFYRWLTQEDRQYLPKAAKHYRSFYEMFGKGEKK